MDAIVLAGGLGTRLRDVVPDLPKPLAPVAGRPFLAWLLEALAAGGAVNRVFLSVGYRAAMIEEAFGSDFAGMRIRYIREDEPLGTGGALRMALAGIEGADAIVLNGDSYSVVDPHALVRAHRSGGRALTLALAAVDDVGRYGSVELVGDTVVGFAEKGGRGPGLINAGVYAMSRGLLDDPALPTRFSFERDFMMPQVEVLRPAAMQLDGMFIDIGVPLDFARAQSLFGRAYAGCWLPGAHA